MVNEVIERVNLLVHVQGSRKVSRQNLQFMFDKYELKEEEQQAVLDHCLKQGISLFDEDGAGPSTEEKKPGAEVNSKAYTKAYTGAQAETPGKKSFLSRIFGR